MSLIQLNQILKIKRMNQLPIYNMYLNEETLNKIHTKIQEITENNKKEETKLIIESILNYIIDSIETFHFEHIHHNELQKKKNRFKRFYYYATKKLHIR